MSAINSFTEIEMAGFDVEGSGVDIGHRRRHTRHFHRRNRIPLDITNEAEIINDYNSNLPFTDGGNHSSANFDHLLESRGIYSYRYNNNNNNNSSSNNNNNNVSLIEENDLESGELDRRANSLSNDEKMCRICHLKLHEEGEEDSGDAIELGCDCKGDLGIAHQNCAMTWFLIRGNLTCEICGATVQNVGLVEIDEVNNEDAEIYQNLESPVTETDQAESSMHIRRIVNVLLSCMVLAFVICLFFRFKMPH